MPRVYAQKAAKDYPDQGIKRGDTYYKWTTRRGPYSRGVMHRSATYPKPWQLTNSPFLQELYRLQYDQDDLVVGEGLDTALEDLSQRYRDLADQAQESLDNIPESLQYAPTGELLQERVDACEAAADELEELAERARGAGQNTEELEQVCDEALSVSADCG